MTIVTTDNTTGYSSGDTYSKKIDFSEDPITKKISGTLSVPTKVDQNNTNGIITVTILDDESVTKNYTLVNDTSKHSAQVSVKNYPKLSISHEHPNVDENERAAYFIVAASYDPGEKLSVNYTVTESSSNFRHTSVKTESQTSIVLTFAQNSLPTNTDWTAKIPIQLRGDDNLDSTDGEIKVTLNPVSINASAKYLVASPPSNTSTVTIRDIDVPTFSISNASATFNGEAAEFMVTSDIRSEQSHTLMVNASNSEGEFLDTKKFNDGVPKPISNVNFTRISTGQFVYILEIPTKIDPNSTRGSFSIELTTNETNDTYGIGEVKTATVSIYSTVTLSVAPPNSKVYEGKELNFILYSNLNPNPLAPLNINYQVSQEGDYLASSVDTSTTMSLNNLIFERDTATRNWLTNIPIPLRNRDKIDTNTGTVSIVLQQPDPTTSKYQIDTTQATAIIHNEPIPIISISDASETTAGEDAEFTITSNVEVDHTISILIEPTNTNGEFLNEETATSGVIRTINNVNFTRSSSGQLIYTLAIPTTIDEDSTTGLITVKLVDDTQQQTSYLISEDTSEQSATVAIINSNKVLPTLSIADTFILEGNEGTSDLNFNVSFSGGTLNFPITVNYAVSEVEAILTPATQGIDFVLEDGNIVIEAGESSKTITAKIVGDRLPESDEMFAIRISFTSTSQIKISNSAGIGTIGNDDTLKRPGIPNLSIISNQSRVIEGDETSFTIYALRPSNYSNPINVQIQISGKEYLLWRAPRQITIPANENKYKLILSTRNVANSEPNEGTITVSIEENETSYTINPNEQSASVKVHNDTNIPQTPVLPRISVAESAVNSILRELVVTTFPIEPVQSAEREFAIVSVAALDQNISEGDVAEFTIFTPNKIAEDLTVFHLQ